MYQQRDCYGNTIYDRFGPQGGRTMAPTRKAAIITPSVDGAWVEDVLGTFDYEADTARYTVMLLTDDEFATLRTAGPAYRIDWAEPGRYVDDTEGAVIVAEDGSLTVEDA